MQKCIDENGVHAKLLANIDRYACTAGVPVDMIVTPLAEYCPEPVVDWVRRIKTTPEHGIALIGSQLEYQCGGVVGALVRNFIDARFRTVAELTKPTRDENSDWHATVLAIPDFGEALVGAKASDSTMIYSLLMARFGESKKTVVGVSDLAALPPKFKTWIETHFLRVKVSR